MTEIVGGALRDVVSSLARRREATARPHAAEREELGDVSALVQACLLSYVDADGAVVQLRPGLRIA